MIVSIPFTTWYHPGLVGCRSMRVIALRRIGVLLANIGSSTLDKKQTMQVKQEIEHDLQRSPPFRQ